MRTVFRIYKADIISIFTNWVALIVIIALIILPALYAWFNIEAAWDPYGNTSGILVAVSNNDKGAAYRDKKINIGKELVDKLKTNKSMGWRFVNNQEADHGVKYGKYYASIIIPEDFSSKIISITETTPHKAELIYSVNEKKNAVAPKITQKGVTTLQQQITTTFVETVNGIIFNVFNEIGTELESGKPLLKNLMNMIFEVDNRIPEINKAVNDLYNGAITLQQYVARVQSDVPLMSDTINKTSDLITKTQPFLIKARDGLKTLTPAIRQNLVLIRNILSNSQSLLDNAFDIAASDPAKLKDLLAESKANYTNAINQINSVLDLLSSIGGTSGNKTIADFIALNENMKVQLQNQVNSINPIIASMDNNGPVTPDMINKLKDGSINITALQDNLISNFDNTTAPALNNIINNSITVSDNALKLLQDAQSDLPLVKDLLNKASTYTTAGIEDISNLKKNLPSIEQSIHSIAGRLRTLNGDESLNELIRLLRLDARKESDFIANPVNIIQNRIFPIPNYGSAMAPFFTTLSLWVGGLILVSILSVTVHKNSLDFEFGSHQAFLGRYLTFATIALFQALMVTVGDILILKVYVSNTAAFILFAMYISLVFSMIIFTLVFVFGNVGKALAMILLVLQISASGGTFPIEVTPPFFRFINPLLPFTYAVGGMREAVGGVLWDLLLTNAAVLALYFAIFIAIGVSWWRIFNKLNLKFVEKFKESNLVEH